MHCELLLYKNLHDKHSYFLWLPNNWARLPLHAFPPNLTFASTFIFGTLDFWISNNTIIWSWKWSSGRGGTFFPKLCCMQYLRWQWSSRLLEYCLRGTPPRAIGTGQVWFHAVSLYLTFPCYIPSGSWPSQHKLANCIWHGHGIRGNCTIPSGPLSGLICQHLLWPTQTQ